MSLEQSSGKFRVDVENIGGISSTSVEFSPGVTLLVGRNATNRTSLLQGIMAGIGSDNVSVKGDADEAEVELTIGDDAYRRRLERRNGHIVSDGEPYLEDSTLPDLFAFLLESNEARRAVENDDDLREIIMKPVDTDEIQAEIERLVQKRRDIDQELDELDSLKERLPSLEEERTQLRDQIEDLEAELAETESELDERDADLEQTREEKAELEEKLSDLREKRSELEDVRYDIETERNSIDSLRSEKNELEAELSDLPETPVGEIDELESRIDRLRTKDQRLKSEISEIQNVIQFNEEMLDGEEGEIADALGTADSDAVTDQLVADDEVTCWTCGTDVNAEQITDTIEQLEEFTGEKRDESKAIRAELDEINEQRRELENQQQRREEIQRRLSKIENDIESSESSIGDLSDRKETLRDEIEDVEAEVESLEDETYEEVLDLHKEANQLEYDLGKVEGNLEQLEKEITEIEAQLSEQDRLEARREELTEEIADLRGKIDQIEQQAVEEFNEHMDTVLNLLGYDNLDRIWIERIETEVREGRRKVTKSKFDLHVIRKSENNTAYEDTVNHLSESEREVTGLIFALAGYLVHEVYEIAPLVVLDSLEAIDADRISSLVDYLSEYAEYLIVALLPEDAAKLDEEYVRISEI